MRWMGGGTFFPPRKRRIANAREAFQRQRAVNIGASSKACVRTFSTVPAFTKAKTNSSGNACCSVNEILIPLSVAAACSSKLNERQHSFRRAKPQDGLMRGTEGAGM